MLLLLKCRSSLSSLKGDETDIYDSIFIQFLYLNIFLLLQVIEDLLCDCVNIFSNVLDGNNLNGWLELQEVSD